MITDVIQLPAPVRELSDVSRMAPSTPLKAWLRCLQATFVLLSQHEYNSAIFAAP